ncbi:phage antirepressor KilAC domain-containing protein [Pectobacterium betavasculorum]|uniref:phage antirepressor KilAC domain-containing protein n=1 Tax=Pectobacterium betavasculorum TaxID=55207 RepID=UPI00313ADECE
MTKSTLAVPNGVVTMSSLDFLNNIINPSRKEASEKPVRPSDFHARVNDEIGGNLNYENFVVGKTGHKTHYTTLNMDQMTLIGMRESKAVRRSVLEKLKSLSRLTSDPMVALNDPEFLRGALLTYSEKVITLTHQVDEMRPDVEAFDRIATKADGSMCITDAAKHLQVQPKFLFKTLSENHWIYRRAGGKAWLGYQDKIQSGYLEHKVTTVSRSDGSEKIVEQALITAKGITKVSKMLGATM